MFSPTRSERTRTLESAGEFASTTPHTHTNGNASGSNGVMRDGLNVMQETKPITNNLNRNGEGSVKPEKKRKKKGWKGWAMVIEDDHGNILEVNDGPEPDPLPSSRRAKAVANSVIAPVPPVAEAAAPVVKSEF